ncbi:MAG: RNase P subunit p30 family protein [Candidatus Bathyarchaeia archaeon]
MKRKFVDLHLCPNLKDMEQVSRLISKASELGYRLIALTVPPNYPEDEIKRLKEMCRQVQIDMASRIDLKPKTPKELIQSLRKFRRKFEVIAVLCEQKSIARQAAKDRRVDLLNFPSLEPRKRFFDRAEAELASKSQASLEIDINPLLKLEGPARVRLLSNLRRETLIAKDFGIPIVLSSGVSNEMLMRKPRELAALSALFDLDDALALEAVSKNPAAIVKRNREKLSPNFVAPGIRIIRMGKDC